MERAQVQLTFVSGTLLLRGVLHERLRGWFSDVVWVYDARVGASRCDGMRYGRVCEELRRREVAFEDLVGVPRPVYWAADSLPELRPEQAAAVEAWQQAGGRGCVVMPTGTGKTEVALRIMQLTRTATLVVAPIRDLMYQWHRRILRGLHYDAGIIGDNTYRVQPVSVTTYDSACIHMAELGDRFGLIVFDECHHLPGRIRQDAARVRGKSLAEYEVVRIPVHLSESEQRRYDLLSEEVQSYVYAQRQENAGFTWEDLCSSSAASLEARQALKAFHAKKSIEDRAEEKLKTLEDLFRLHAGERCIVFAGSNAMARDVSVRFLIPCLLSHCGRRERLEILEGFAAGDYPAIVANQVLDEGIDVPAAKVAIVIGGLGSSRQARQRLVVRTIFIGGWCCRPD